MTVASGSAYAKGARFDAWGEVFKLERWTEAFKENGLDPAFYANRKREYDEVLPWDHIDTGVTKDFLIKENEKAVKGEMTPDCRKGECNDCGVKGLCETVKTAKTPVAAPKSSEPSSIIPLPFLSMN